MLKGTPHPGLDGAKMIAGEDGSGLSELEVDTGRTAAFNLDCSCSLQMQAGGLGRNFRKKMFLTFPYYLLPRINSSVFFSLRPLFHAVELFKSCVNEGID